MVEMLLIYFKIIAVVVDVVVVFDIANVPIRILVSAHEYIHSYVRDNVVEP